MFRRDGYRCQICKKNYANEVDHIVRGDDHAYDNLQAICKPCHQKKTFNEAMIAKAMLKPQKSGTYWVEEYQRRKNDGTLKD